MTAGQSQSVTGLRPVDTADVSQKKSGRGRRAFLILAALALLVLGGIGVYAFVTGGQESTDDAVVEADVVAVTARVGGVVKQILVEDNQPVKKGDVLIQIDDADLATKLAQARADLGTATAQAAAADAQRQVVEASARGGFSTAQAQVAGSTAAVEAADAQIAAAEAAIARAQAEARKTEADLARAKELIATEAIARQQLDNAQFAYDAAQAGVVQARANLANAQEAKRTAQSRVAEAQGRLSQSTPVQAQIDAARAAAELAHSRVKAAEAAVALAELQLSYTKVLAPENGLVTQLSAREGGLVQAGQPLAHVVPEHTYVIANFKETQIDAMRPGNRATIEIDAYPDRKFEAVVDSLAGGTGSRFSLIPPDNASGNFVKVVQRVPVRLEWKQPPDVPLKAGLSAVVTVYVDDDASR
jgi:membrane fusion protein (multidrug efflux system)